jgi:glycosyltransferase involved in cell wall biosynthesis
MHIAIPFDVETVKRSWGQAERMWGRAVANHDFVAALAAAPGCRQLTLLVPSRKDVSLLRQTLLASGRAAVVPMVEWPGWLARDPPDVMHVLDPEMWMAAHLRNQLADRHFVITGLTHSLANQHFLQWALLNDANGVTAADCLVCTTPTARAVLESAFARLRAARQDFQAPSTRVIPLGVTPAPGAPGRAEARAALGWDPQAFVVLSLARFNPHFKMDLLPVLQLVTLVAAGGGRRVRFVLAGSSEGEGEYLGYVRRWIRDAGVESLVELEPNPDEPRKAALLGAADAFLSLSDNLQETFGLTVVEAMAAGLPVIASDWDGYRSLVEEGRSGFRVPTRALPADPAWEALLPLRSDPQFHLVTAQSTAVDLDVAAERVGRLAADDGLARAMGQEARRRAGAFAWPVVMEAYLALWRELLAAGGAGVFPGPRRSSALLPAVDFAGYATALLQPEDRFGITGLGTRALAGKVQLHFYADTEEFLDRDLMARILRACTGAAALAQLLALGPTPHVVRQNVLWLYKQGFIRPA